MKISHYYAKRLSTLKEEIGKQGLDAFLVTNDANVSYLSGFEGKDSILLITLDSKFFITDSRYLEEAHESIKDFNIKLVDVSTYRTIKDLINKNHLKRIGFESMNVPHEVAHRLKALIRSAKLAPVKGLVEGLRAVKEVGEINLIKDSITITKSVLKKIARSIRPGMSERLLNKKAKLEFINMGAHPNFEPIIASGRNSSKPHARTTNARLARNSFVMVDIGCLFKGYNSDITRMFVLGKVKAKFKEIYNIVIDAQKRALDKIQPGAIIAEVDNAARQYIYDRGFGRYFGHSLGHGVGLEVHEEPTISKINRDLLSKGMVFTVEPAIYVPGFGGARIEDMVLVTDSGYEILTR